MPRTRIPRLLAVSAFVVACELHPVDTCACSLPPPYDIVYGTVTAPGGGAVAGATVQADVGGPECQSSVERESLYSDAAGRYRIPVFHTGGYAQQCIRLVALAPAGSGWHDSDTVRFTMPTPQSHPPDSVRHDLALRAP